MKTCLLAISVCVFQVPKVCPDRILQLWGCTSTYSYSVIAVPGCNPFPELCVVENLCFEDVLLRIYPHACFAPRLFSWHFQDFSSEALLTWSVLQFLLTWGARTWWEAAARLWQLSRELWMERAVLVLPWARWVCQRNIEVWGGGTESAVVGGVSSFLNLKLHGEREGCVFFLKKVIYLLKKQPWEHVL